MIINPYLVFHNITEVFSIVVSFSIFGLGWFSYDQSKDRRALFLSVAFFGIGMLDFFHMLSYAGMPDFITPNSTNKATQFWIAARFFGALMFLLSGSVQGSAGEKKPKLPLFIFAFATIIAFFVAIVFFSDLLPAFFIDGKGLTLFKKISEYAIIGILVGAGIIYARLIKTIGERNALFYICAFILCIFSEAAFTLYASAFDTFNCLGHIYKIAAFLLIYIGNYIASVKDPYSQIAKINTSMQAEIVERKTAEEQALKSLHEREVLILELYHRTKNTMGVVLSIMGLQAARHPDNSELQDFVNDIGLRIQAISVVHQMLYKSNNLSRISLKEYVNELSFLVINTFEGRQGRISLNVDIEDQFLVIDTAIPLGLILNELLTNSVKHAFPDGRKGTISISLKKQGVNSTLLNYSDNGVGSPEGVDYRKKETLGLQLIFGIGETQLHGRVDMAGENGFTCRFEFPNDNYKERV